MNNINRIKLLRVSEGITQDQLSQLLDVSRATISAWEKDKAEPTITHLKRMCVLFDCSADYLIGLSDEKKCK